MIVLVLVMYSASIVVVHHRGRRLHHLSVVIDRRSSWPFIASFDSLSLIVVHDRCPFMSSSSSVVMVIVSCDRCDVA